MMQPSESQARIELACAYRLFATFGWHELIYNHITLRVPGTHEHFLINPFGLMYDEVCASNLVKVDLDGNIVGDSAHGINPAGFIVHSSVHRVRRDAKCVMHMHSTAGLAVACQQEGLLPLSLPSAFFIDRVAYHPFEGLTLHADERERLATNLGTKNVMILRNHGLLTCGPSVADAFHEMYNLQRACEAQIAAQSGDATLIRPDPSVIRKAAEDFDRTARHGPQNALLFAAMMRWMDRVDDSYRL